MTLLGFIIKYIPFDTIYIRKDKETVAIINSTSIRRTKESLKVCKLAIFKSIEVDESLRFAILNSTNFELRCGSNYIEVILNG